MRCFGAFPRCNSPVRHYFIVFGKVQGLCMGHYHEFYQPTYSSYEEAQLALVKRKL